MELKQDKRKLLRDLNNLKTKALQRGGKIPPPEGKTESFLDVESKRILQEAKDEKTTRKAVAQKDITTWANDEAKFVSSRLKNAVSVIGGFGAGTPNICGVCGKTVAHTITTFDEGQGRMVCKCDVCRKTGRQPRKSYLKIVIH